MSVAENDRFVTIDENPILKMEMNCAREDTAFDVAALANQIFG